MISMPVFPNTDWPRKEAIKQLYALYISDTQIIAQKISVFFAVNALLGLSFTVSSKPDYFPELITVVVGLFVTGFGSMYSVIAHNDVAHTHRYRIWYRRQLEGAFGSRGINLFPGQKEIDEIDVGKESRSANRFVCLFWVIGVFWSIGVVYYGSRLFSMFCRCAT